MIPRFTPAELRKEAERLLENDDPFERAPAMLLQAAHDAERLAAVRMALDVPQPTPDRAPKPGA
jgi:hypothetical protein